MKLYALPNTTLTRLPLDALTSVIEGPVLFSTQTSPPPRAMASGPAKS